MELYCSDKGGTQSIMDAYIMYIQRQTRAVGFLLSINIGDRGVYYNVVFVLFILNRRDILVKMFKQWTY